MKSVILFFLFISIGGLAIAKNSMTIPNGYLIFSEGQSLYKMDLKTCNRTELYNNNLKIFNTVSKIDNDRFLFYQYADCIKMFNVKTKKMDLIYQKASTPYYNPVHRKIFFYYSTGLYEMNFGAAIKTARRVADTKNTVENIIPVSDNQIVFLKTDDGNNNKVYIYNIVTQKLNFLPIKNCTIPQIWHSATKQLMCFNRDKYQYFFTDLSGQNIQVMKTPRSFLPILYLPEYDELLFTVNTFSFRDPEEGHLWIYDFKTGESKLLCDDIKLGTGDAIYYPN